jgi:SAM-dependent methyltransferase
MARLRPPVLAQETFREHEAKLNPLELGEKFRYIHRVNMWGSPESTSGVGSTFEATAPIRDGISRVCREFAVESLLDAPCGDASWITASSLPVKRYIGIDIVPELIAANIKHRESPNSEFHVADLTCADLPDCDLILCRDCLVHLSFANIGSILRNFKNSGSKYLLTTTFPEHDENYDIADGDWRLLNLEKYPFSFPPPVRLIDEECTEIGGAYRDKSLALWEIASLPI